MANVQKYNRAQVGHLLKHFSRAKENGIYVKFKNENINIRNTPLNYTLTERDDNLSDYEFIKKRTEELKCLKRKDVNVMASWVVTMPKEYYEKADAFDYLQSENEKTYKERFFEETYKFLVSKYGKDNIIGGYVHLDETTPHMHFAFIPAVWDNKKQRYKVSSKECLDKFHLHKFHPELNEFLNKKLKKELKELGINDIGILVNEDKDRKRQYTPRKELEQRIKSLEKDNRSLKIKQKEYEKTMKNIKFKNGQSIFDFHFEQIEKQKQKQKQKQNSKFKSTQKNKNVKPQNQGDESVGDDRF